MSTFILIIIAIGMLGIPISCLFTLLSFLFKKWKNLLKYSLMSLGLALICTTMGLISYSVLGTGKSAPKEADIADFNTAMSTMQSPDNLVNISDDKFLESVKTAIQGRLGSGETIQSVTLENRDLRILVDLSQKASSPVTAKELALSRTSSITDPILDLYEYDALWDTITVDFGDLGYIRNSQKDIQENEYGLRYFPYENFKLINSLKEESAEDIAFLENPNEIIENNGWTENSNKDSIDVMLKMIESVLAQNYGENNYTINCDYDYKIISLNVWHDGIAAELTLIKLQGGDATDESWIYLKNSVIYAANSICNLMETCGHGDFTLSFNLLNDINQENVLLSTFNSTIIYDVMEEQ